MKWKITTKMTTLKYKSSVCTRSYMFELIYINVSKNIDKFYDIIFQTDTSLTPYYKHMCACMIYVLIYAMYLHVNH